MHIPVWVSLIIILYYYFIRSITIIVILFANRVILQIDRYAIYLSVDFCIFLLFLQSESDQFFLYNIEEELLFFSISEQPFHTHRQDHNYYIQPHRLVPNNQPEHMWCLLPDFFHSILPVI